MSEQPRITPKVDMDFRTQGLEDSVKLLSQMVLGVRSLEENFEFLEKLPQTVGRVNKAMSTMQQMVNNLSGGFKTFQAMSNNIRAMQGLSSVSPNSPFLPDFFKGSKALNKGKPSLSSLSDSELKKYGAEVEKTINALNGFISTYSKTVEKAAEYAKNGYKNDSSATREKIKQAKAELAKVEKELAGTGSKALNDADKMAASARLKKLQEDLKVAQAEMAGFDQSKKAAQEVISSYNKSIKEVTQQRNAAARQREAVQAVFDQRQKILEEAAEEAKNTSTRKARLRDYKQSGAKAFGRSTMAVYDQSDEAMAYENQRVSDLKARQRAKLQDRGMIKTFIENEDFAYDPNNVLEKRLKQQALKERTGQLGRDIANLQALGSGRTSGESRMLVELQETLKRLNDSFNVEGNISARRSQEAQARAQARIQAQEQAKKDREQDALARKALYQADPMRQREAQINSIQSGMGRAEKVGRYAIQTQMKSGNFDVGAVDSRDLSTNLQRAKSLLRSSQEVQASGIDQQKEIANLTKIVDLINQRIKAERESERLQKAKPKRLDQLEEEAYNENNQIRLLERKRAALQKREAADSWRTTANNTAAGGGFGKQTLAGVSQENLGIYVRELREALKVKLAINDASGARYLNEELEAIRQITNERKKQEADQARLVRDAERAAADPTKSIELQKARDAYVGNVRSNLEAGGSVGSLAGKNTNELKMLNDALKLEIERLSVIKAQGGAVGDRIKQLEEEQRQVKDTITTQNPQDNPTNKRFKDLFTGEGTGGLFGIQALLQVNYAIQNAVTTPIQQAIQFIRQYQVELANFKAISQATTQEVDSLDKTITRLASSFKYSQTEMAQAATQLAQAGFSARDTEQALSGVVKLAVASGASLSESVDLTTSVIGVFNITADQTEAVANRIAVAMNESKSNLGQFSLAMQYAGNTAAEARIPFEELLAAAGGLANAGIKSGSTIGTGLRQLITEFEAPTDKFKDNLALVGLTVSDVNVRTHGLVKVLETLKEAGFNSTYALNSFEIRSAAAFNGLINNLEDVKRLQSDVLTKNALDPAVAAQVETLDAALARLTNNFNALVNTALAPVATALNYLVSGMANVAKFLNDVSSSSTLARITIQALGVTLTGLLSLGVAMYIANMVDGFMRAGVAARALTVAMVELRGAMAFMAAMNPWVLGLTALAAAATAYAMSTKTAAEAAEESKTAMNNLDGEIKQNENQIKSLTDRLTELYTKQGDLTDGSEDLKVAIQQANSDFASLGFTVDSTTGKFSDLTAEIMRNTVALRQNILTKQKEADAAAAETLLQLKEDAKAKREQNYNKGILGGLDAKLSKDNYAGFLKSGNFRNGSNDKEVAANIVRILGQVDAGKDLNRADQQYLMVNRAQFETIMSRNRVNLTTPAAQYNTVMSMVQSQRAVEDFELMNKGRLERNSRSTVLANLGSAVDESQARIQSFTYVADKQKNLENINNTKNELKKLNELAARSTGEQQKVLKEIIGNLESDFNAKLTLGGRGEVDTSIKGGKMRSEILKAESNAAAKRGDKVTAEKKAQDAAKLDGVNKLVSNFSEAGKFMSVGQDGVAFLDPNKLTQAKVGKDAATQAKLEESFTGFQTLLTDYTTAMGDKAAAGTRGGGGGDRVSRNDEKSLKALADAREKQAQTYLKQAKMEEDSSSRVVSLRDKAMNAMEEAYQADKKAIAANKEYTEEQKTVFLQAAEIDHKEKINQMLLEFAKKQGELNPATVAMKDAFENSEKALDEFNNKLQKLTDSLTPFSLQVLKKRQQLYSSQYGEADSLLMQREDRNLMIKEAREKLPVVNDQISRQEGYLNTANQSVDELQQSYDYYKSLRNSLPEGQEKSEATAQMLAAEENLNKAIENRAKLESGILDMKRQQLEFQSTLSAAENPSRDSGNYIQDLTEAWRLATEASQEYINNQSTISDMASGMMNVIKSGSNSFGQMFTDIATNSKTAKEAFRSFANGILQSMMQVVQNEISKQFMKLILGMLTSSYGSASASPVGGDYSWFSATGVKNGGMVTEYGTIKRFGNGGAVTGATKNRDSVRALLMPEEVVLNANAVNSIGKDFALDINRRGAKAFEGMGSTNIIQNSGGESVTNVWIVTPDQKPNGLGEKDVIAVVEDNISRGGSVKKLIKRVVNNG